VDDGVEETLRFSVINWVPLVDRTWAVLPRGSRSSVISRPPRCSWRRN